LYVVVVVVVVVEPVVSLSFLSVMALPSYLMSVADVPYCSTRSFKAVEKLQGCFK
jgi:hypothetical protein